MPVSQKIDIVQRLVNPPRRGRFGFASSPEPALTDNVPIWTDVECGDVRVGLRTYWMLSNQVVSRSPELVAEPAFSPEYIPGISHLRQAQLILICLRLPVRLALTNLRSSRR